MLLTITTTHSPATDLGYLLHKHPDRVQRFNLSVGEAVVFYPQADPARCTAALLLDIDPITLVRSLKTRGRNRSASHYVNDRPYVASSFMSVAIGKVFGTAMGGRCPQRPQLVEEAIPLELTVAVIPVRGGEGWLRRLFEPLGYEVNTEANPLDDQFPQWGDSIYLTVRLKHTIRLAEALNHLYVLIPVLDREKHYWVGDDEVDKLLRKGGIGSRLTRSGSRLRDTIFLSAVWREQL